QRRLRRRPGRLRPGQGRRPARREGEGAAARPGVGLAAGRPGGDGPPAGQGGGARPYSGHGRWFIDTLAGGRRFCPRAPAGGAGHAARGGTTTVAEALGRRGRDAGAGPGEDGAGEEVARPAPNPIPEQTRAAGELSPPSKIPHRPDIAPAPGLRAGRDGISFNRRPVPERTEIMWFSSRLQNRKRHQSPRMRPSFRPRLQPLEGREVPSTLTLTVNSLGDSGAGSGTAGDLRYCINLANQNNNTSSTPDVINFAPGLSGTDTLLNGELYISDANLVINGPGATKL